MVRALYAESTAAHQVGADLFMAAFVLKPGG